MSDLVHRIKTSLEPVLELADPRERISAYHDMPYALFRYEPEEEFELRKQITLLETRLTQKGKRVRRISLAECLDEAMRSQRPLEDWFAAEREQGTDTIVETVHSVLSEYAPLVDLVAAQMPDEPEPAPRHRFHHAHRRSVSRVPHVLIVGAAERDGSPCRQSCSTQAISTVRQGSGSWACSQPSITIAQRSFDGISVMANEPIKSLFANDIHRRIEEVIKVDQTSDDILRDEINEYVVTDAIRSHYTNIFDAFRETPNKPHEGIAIWVSGFFGSGKSSFAKMLGLSIENRVVAGIPAGDRFAQRAGDNKLQVLLKAINEKIPTHAVIFDVSTDRGIRSGNQSLTEIMYGLFLQSLGYAKDLDLSELEIALEEKGQLEGFEAEYGRLFNKEWSFEKGKVAFALSEASRVLHSLDPETYPMADSWVKAVKNKADISPGKLAERANELMKRRRPGQALMFVVDEVGQFVARDVQKMLDLQAVVQSLGVKGRGKHWIVVTSQEKLGELVSGLDDKKIELARLMDRFPLQVHLEPSDISEVTSRRVLSKNAPAQKVLGELFDQHRGRFTEHTRLTADIKLPELTRDSFIDLYPLLPYQIDLIIQVVSGLRTQGGASKHVGGANRTIIKLAQQLLINPAVNLADQPIGSVARLDQVYDLVEGNIGSEVRAKISAISKELEHPLAQPVAKVICLLQYVKSVHRTAENIAAALHPGVAADSQFAAVKDALRQLEAANKVRLGDDGYRIPTPAEDDWERVRNGISPKPGDAHRIYSEVLASFWQPQPSHTLFDTKTFKAGLAIHGREIVDGDMMFHVHLAEDGAAFQALASELRARSQQERKNVFWAVSLNRRDRS